jgi:hypothetical protein
MAMTAKDQPQKVKPPLVSRNEWLVGSLVAALITLSNAGKNPGVGITPWLFSFIGCLAGVLFLWVLVREIFYWIKGK